MITADQERMFFLLDTDDRKDVIRQFEDIETVLIKKLKECRQYLYELKILHNIKIKQEIEKK